MLSGKASKFALDVSEHTAFIARCRAALSSHTRERAKAVGEAQEEWAGACAAVAGLLRDLYGETSSDNKGVILSILQEFGELDAGDLGGSNTGTRDEN